MVLLGYQSQDQGNEKYYKKAFNEQCSNLAGQLDFSVTSHHDRNDIFERPGRTFTCFLGDLRVLGKQQI